ncbi:hypothetical protein L596_029454 [Steinernema carpocapsae]|uniref:G-protein coupled receptors family 2 profile 2 domain-containing protein n=1 Tax=Steinernema carpocapsae TaxID=34508 RepID=A0A4U5LUP7_STECR|nr:hypothetical protein L596_029454 [Steinernema carpocapsae]
MKSAWILCLLILAAKIEVWEVFQKGFCIKAKEDCSHIKELGYWPVFLDCEDEVNADGSIRSGGRGLFKEGLDCKMPYPSLERLPKAGQCIWPLVNSTSLEYESFIDGCHLPCRSPLVKQASLGVYATSVVVVSFVLLVIAFYAAIWIRIITLIYKRSLAVFALCNYLFCVGSYYFILFVTAFTAEHTCLDDGRIRSVVLNFFCVASAFLKHYFLWTSFAWISVFLAIVAAPALIEKLRKKRPNADWREVLLYAVYLPGFWVLIAQQALNLTDVDGATGSCGIGLRSYPDFLIFVIIPILVIALPALILAVMALFRNRGFNPARRLRQEFRQQLLTMEQGSEVELGDPMELPQKYICCVAMFLFLALAMMTAVRVVTMDVTVETEKEEVMRSLTCSLNETFTKADAIWSKHPSYQWDNADVMARRREMLGRTASSPHCEVQPKYDNHLFIHFLIHVFFPAMPLLVVLVFLLNSTSREKLGYPDFYSTRDGFLRRLWRALPGQREKTPSDIRAMEMDEIVTQGNRISPPNQRISPELAQSIGHVSRASSKPGSSADPSGIDPVTETTEIGYIAREEQTMLLREPRDTDVLLEIPPKHIPAGKLIDETTDMETTDSEMPQAEVNRRFGSTEQLKSAARMEESGFETEPVTSNGNSSARIKSSEAHERFQNDLERREILESSSDGEGAMTSVSQRPENIPLPAIPEQNEAQNAAPLYVPVTHLLNELGQFVPVSGTFDARTGVIFNLQLPAPILAPQEMKVGEEDDEDVSEDADLQSDEEEEDLQSEDESHPEDAHPSDNPTDPMCIILSENFEVESKIDDKKCVLNPYYLARFLANHEDILGTPKNITPMRHFDHPRRDDPDDENLVRSTSGYLWEFGPQHVALYFPDDYAYYSEFTEDDLEDEFGDMTTKVANQVDKCKDRRDRYEAFFDLMLAYGLVRRYYPEKPTLTVEAYYGLLNDEAAEFNEQYTDMFPLHPSVFRRVPSDENLEDPNQPGEQPQPPHQEPQQRIQDPNQPSTSGLTREQINAAAERQDAEERARNDRERPPGRSGRAASLFSPGRPGHSTSRQAPEPILQVNLDVVEGPEDIPVERRVETAAERMNRLFDLEDDWEAFVVSPDQPLVDRRLYEGIALGAFEGEPEEEENPLKPYQEAPEDVWEDPSLRESRQLDQRFEFFQNERERRNYFAQVPTIEQVQVRNPNWSREKCEAVVRFLNDPEGIQMLMWQVGEQQTSSSAVFNLGENIRIAMERVGMRVSDGLLEELTEWYRDQFGDNGAGAALPAVPEADVENEDEEETSEDEEQRDDTDEGVASNSSNSLDHVPDPH